MAKYVFIVFGLTFFVDLLLILGTNRLAGYPSGIKRAVPAGLLGGCYATLCLIPSFSFFGKGAWQIVTLGLFVLVAFGLNHSTLRRTVTWLLLKFALHGAAASFENGGFGALCLQLCYLREFDRDSLNLLLEELCSRLHRQGKYLMFSAPAKLSDSDSSPACAGLDFEALGYFCDKVLLRCYDWAHGGTAPQSPAPLPLVRQGLEYALKFIPSWKLLLGISDHGYRWHLPWRQGDGADAVSHRIAQATAISNAVPIRFDRLSQTPFFSFDPSCSQRCIICYDDAASLKLKLELIKEYDLAGAALYSDSRPDFRLLYMMQEMFNPEKFM